MKTFLILTSALAFIASFAACDIPGRGDNNATSVASEPAATELTAEEVITRAVEQWSKTESAHFTLEIDGKTYLDNKETISLSSAEGDLKRPQSVKAVAKISIGLVNLDVSLIFIGDKAYMTDFLTGDWGPAPGDFSYNPGLLLSETEGLGPVMKQMQNPELLGIEKLPSGDAYHLSGEVSEGRIRELTAGAIVGDVIKTDIWFDSDSFDVLKLNLAEPAGGDTDPTTWIIRLSDQNKPVEIKAPE